MLRVNRDAVPIPVVLDDVNSKGKIETQASIKFYRKASNKGKTYPGFKVYKDATVKDALNKLFHLKCAYCDIDYGGAPLDVEHFRPKSAVVETVRGKDTLKKPGYYWLAADWYNLLPSCIDCNRPRVHGTATGKRSVMGKANKFPLASGTKREKRHTADVEATEARLLLDPCRDNAEKHLRYDIVSGVVKPRRIKGVPSPMALASIECYGLQRELLVEKRHTHSSKLQFHIDAANRYAEDLRRNKGNRIARREMDITLKEIKSFIEPRKPFIAMSKQIIREKLKIV
jgi:uncharacterized protein (TIGR02646 family)